MDEKKMNNDTDIGFGMTDEAIIETLKELAIKHSKDKYVYRVLANTIDLINRQKEEISLLKKQPITPSVIDLSVENGLLKDKIERLTEEMKAFTKCAPKMDFTAIGMLECEKKRAESLLNDAYLDQNELLKERNEALKKNAELQNQVDECNRDCEEYAIERADKLQKQVEELKSENTELYKENTALIAGSILKKQDIVKDTAKEIISLLEDMDKRGMTVPFNMVLRQLKERYGVEVE